MFVRPLVREGGMVRPMNAGDALAANFNITLFNAEADATLTISELAGGHIFQGSTLTSDVIYTLPTAAIIDAANGFVDMNVGDAFSFIVTNSQAAAFDTVIAVGVGITAKGTNNSLSVPPQSSRVFTLVKTDDDAFDLY
jgi:hypothetical protein